MSTMSTCTLTPHFAASFVARDLTDPLRGEPENKYRILQTPKFCETSLHPCGPCQVPVVSGGGFSLQFSAL